VERYTERVVDVIEEEKNICENLLMTNVLVRLHRALIGILTMVMFLGVEMARGISQSPGRRVDEDRGAGRMNPIPKSPTLPMVKGR